MRKIFTLLFTIFSLYSFAGFISKDSCQKVAINFYYEKTGKRPVVQSIEKDTIAHGKILGYAFNFKNGGFVIVRNQNMINPIIGWNPTNAFTFKIPAYQRGLLHHINNANEKTKAASYLKASHSHQYARLTATNPVKVTIVKTVGPLLTTGYDQYPYYNALCPTQTNGDCSGAEQAVTGCVSTAMVQIMKYWNYPPKGTGKNSYTDAPPSYSFNYGFLSDTFSNHTYQWQNMGSSATATNYLAIAQIMYDAGIAVNMDYGNICEGGSGANVIGNAPSAQAAYVNNFGYKNVIQAIVPPTDSTATYLQAIKTELDSSRVVQMEGFDVNNYGGHTWVCDGYELMSDGSILFHMNWGWSLQDDAWFSLNNLSVSGYNFISGEGVLTHIQPSGTVPPPTPCAAPVLNTATNLTTTSATISWTGSDSSYVVQYAANGSTNYTTINTTANSVSLTGLNSGTTYNWQVTGVCKGGTESGTPTSSFTTIALPCGAPTNLTVTNITATSVTLSWTAGQANNSWFVWNGTTASGSQSATAASTTSLNLTGLTANTSYSWFVEGKCGSGQANSPEYSFTTSASTPCGIVTILTSTVTDSSAVISWTAVTGAISYNVMYKQASVTNWTTISYTINTANLKGLTANTAYNYQVQAVCAGGATGAYSLANSFTTLSVPVPPTPVPACAFQGRNTYEFIKYDTINGVASSPGDVAYTLSTKAITLKANNTFTLIDGFTGSSYPETWGVYLYTNNTWQTLYKANTATKLTGAFSCPSFTGTAVLRVVIGWSSGNPTQCNAANGGTAIDYPVTYSVTADDFERRK